MEIRKPERNFDSLTEITCHLLLQHENLQAESNSNKENEIPGILLYTFDFPQKYSSKFRKLKETDLSNLQYTVYRYFVNNKYSTGRKE
jgi:hypothetical protein